MAKALRDRIADPEFAVVAGGGSHGGMTAVAVREVGQVASSPAWPLARWLGQSSAKRISIRVMLAQAGRDLLPRGDAPRDDHRPVDDEAGGRT